MFTIKRNPCSRSTGIRSYVALGPKDRVRQPWSGFSAPHNKAARTQWKSIAPGGISYRYRCRCSHLLLKAWLLSRSVRWLAEGPFWTLQRIERVADTEVRTHSTTLLCGIEKPPGRSKRRFRGQRHITIGATLRIKCGAPHLMRASRTYGSARGHPVMGRSYRDRIRANLAPR
jgi:hypothetical protein